MTTRQAIPQIQPDFSQVLDRAMQLDLAQLERLSLELNSLVARRKTPNLLMREAELLEEINRGLPTTDWQRYHTLNQKLLDDVLTAGEDEELGVLIERIEEFDVRRLRALIELAQLRKIPLDRLMTQLGIHRQLDV